MSEATELAKALNLVTNLKTHYNLLRSARSHEDERTPNHRSITLELDHIRAAQAHAQSCYDSLCFAKELRSNRLAGKLARIQAELGQLGTD